MPQQQLTFAIAGTQLEASKARQVKVQLALCCFHKPAKQLLPSASCV
jgi:hypothetical protein